MNKLLSDGGREHNRLKKLIVVDECKNYKPELCMVTSSPYKIIDAFRLKLDG